MVEVLPFFVIKVRKVFHCLFFLIIIREVRFFFFFILHNKIRNKQINDKNNSDFVDDF